MKSQEQRTSKPIRRHRHPYRIAVAFAVAACLISWLLTPPSAGAAGILVAGSCTLPDAVAAAEADSAVGGCSAGSGADVIHLGRDVVLAAVTDLGTPWGPSALPLITTAITVRGNGFAVRMAPGVSGRIFSVGDTGNLTLTSMLIADATGWSAIRNEGTLTIRSVTLRDNYRAIENTENCSIVDSAFINNVNTHLGGAIWNTAFTTMTVQRSRFSGNRVIGAQTGRGGGAIHQGGGSSSLAIFDSLFQDNVVTAGDTGGLVFGGAIHITGGPGSSLIERSTFAGNSVSGVNANGGGIYIQSATRIINSTFSDNRAVGSTSGQGGALAISAADKVVEIANSTFVGNVVEPAGASSGNAVHDFDSVPTPITIRNVVATGSAPSCVGVMTDGGGNFGCLGGPAVTGLDPVLAMHGGQTPTHALASDSNAVDAGGLFCGTLTDQRWANRSGNCDSGAFEAGGCPDDRHEVFGLPGVGDNQCYGAPIERSGVAQSHRMCNADWVFFGTSVGASYRVETGNLEGGADTLISASSLCAGFFASDDNSGAGLASRLEFGGTGGLVGVRVEDAGGLYGPGKGYDVIVTCTGGCPCSSPYGLDLTLSGGTVNDARAYQVCRTLTAGNGLAVHSGGALLLAAGKSVTLTNTFTVFSGGELIIVQDADLSPGI